MTQSATLWFFLIILLTWLFWVFRGRNKPTSEIYVYDYKF